MHTVSRDSPCYYLTSVTKDRLEVFKKDEIKLVSCAALDEARRSGGFAIYAYVIMLDHFHLITDSGLKPSKTLQYVNGVVSHRIIDYLKERHYSSSLRKLQHEAGRRGYRYSVWDHHPDVRVLFTEDMLMQRVHYTHQNPVRAGFVERAEDYRWSSIRFWNGAPMEDEPLLMDIKQIKWRR